MATNKEFAIFILTYGRPNNVKTYNTLIRCGYTGPIYLIVDTSDVTIDQYFEKFGRDNVIVFDKNEIRKNFDQGDNFEDLRTIVFARNACFKIACDLGVNYFIQLDDDYLNLQYRFDENLNYKPSTVKNLDRLLSCLLSFFKKTTRITSLAISQGGDFIGGENNTYTNFVRTKRKAMNFFICSTDRWFNFVGRINEDVNTYTRLASIGGLFITLNQVSLEQVQTQTGHGGMSDIYLDSGTYVKSFYSVIYHPSSVKIAQMGDRNNYRLHHQVNWKATAPMILGSSLKKKNNFNKNGI